MGRVEEDAQKLGRVRRGPLAPRMCTPMCPGRKHPRLCLDDDGALGVVIVAGCWVVDDDEIVCVVLVGERDRVVR